MGARRCRETRVGSDQCQELGEAVDEMVGTGGTEVGGRLVAVGDAAGETSSGGTHEDVVAGVTDHKGLLRSNSKGLQDDLHGFRMRLVALHIVGADNHAEIILQLEGADEAVERGTGTAAADGQLQTTMVEGREGLEHLGEEGDNAGMVVLVEDTAVDVGASLSHSVVDSQQGGEALLQRQTDDGLAFVVGARREMQRTDSALQTTDDKGLSVGQRAVEVEDDESCHFWADMYCSSRRWTYLPKTSNSMLTTVPGRKLWKLVT